MRISSDARWQTRRSDERGTSAVDYGLMIALIAAVIITAAIALGQSLVPGLELVIARWP